jgi:predicted nucleic acid-binding protein
MDRIILDTNVFVAAGFNPRSHAARIMEVVRAGDVRMVWNEATRRETLAVVGRIPPLANYAVAGLFRAADRFDGLTHPESFPQITDPDDRKFAALAHATGALLITRDAHLLEHRATLPIAILTASDYWRRLQAPHL